MNDLLEFARELTKNGFRVWHAKTDRPSYLYVADRDGNLGYVQETKFSFAYATVHKPSTAIGTGFRFCEEATLSIDTMAMCCRCVAPNWWSKSLSLVKKWTLEKWIEANPQLVEFTIANQQG